MIVYLNGHFMNEKEAHISIDDHGFLYGDGVYETIRVQNGVPVFLADHLIRLFKSARAIHLRMPLTKRAFFGIIDKLLKKNKHAEGALRITLTRGPGPHGFDPRFCPKPTLLIRVFHFTGYPERLHRKGISAGIVTVRRNSPLSIPPSIKSNNCLNGILAKMQAIEMKCDEGIFLDLRGFVAEGTVSNVFMVKQGKVLTPTLDGQVLPGVTQARVMRIVNVRQKKITPQELFSADEIFLTNALMGVMSVSRLVQNGKTRKLKVGPVTQRIITTFRRSLRSPLTEKKIM